MFLILWLTVAAFIFSTDIIAGIFLYHLAANRPKSHEKIRELSKNAGSFAIFIFNSIDDISSEHEDTQIGTIVLSFLVCFFWPIVLPLVFIYYLTCFILMKISSVIKKFVLLTFPKD